jgi:Domain of unknown function (DUF4276)
MATLHLACIVEGHGEVQAVPILLRRIVEFVNPAVHADIQHPIRIPRSHLLNQGGLENALELAIRGLPESGVVLVLIDSDKDCPKEVAPLLLARAASTAAGRRPVAVVLAKCEFENWFIAAAESIAGYGDLRLDLVAPPDPESIRGAKEWLRNQMPRGKKYSETIDQPSLASRFDLHHARRAPSFDKLYREMERFCALAAAMP